MKSGQGHSSTTCLSTETRTELCCQLASKKTRSSKAKEYGLPGTVPRSALHPALSVTMCNNAAAAILFTLDGKHMF